VGVSDWVWLCVGVNCCVGIHMVLWLWLAFLVKVRVFCPMWLAVHN